MPDSVYCVKAVCQLTGLKATTLHVWEKRYGAVRPKRFSNNQRYYTADDVSKLSLLIAARDLGHRIGSIAGLSISELRSIIPTAPSPDSLQIPYRKSKSSSSQGFCDRTLQALSRNHFDRVHQELEAARLRLGITGFVLDFIVPLLQRVKKMREEKSLSMVRQQMLFHSIKSNIHVASLQLRLQTQSPLRKRVALAAVNCDQTELEVMLATLLCTVAGMSAHYLGTRVPFDALAEAVHELRIERLIISLPRNQEKDAAQENLSQDLLPRLPQSCEVWIGGEPHNAGKVDKDSCRMLHIRSLRELYHSLQVG